MAGDFLIIDMRQEPPVLMSTDDVIPAAILQELQAIRELIMTQGAAEQAQLQTLADGMNVVSSHVSSAAAALAQWIADNQHAPLDFTPALNALSSLQAADTTLGSIVPAAPATPLPEPVPDPGPPIDPGTPIDTGTPPDPTDPSTPPDLPPGGDLGAATDPGTGGDVSMGDTGGGADSQPPPL